MIKKPSMILEIDLQSIRKGVTLTKEKLIKFEALFNGVNL